MAFMTILQRFRCIYVKFLIRQMNRNGKRTRWRRFVRNRVSGDEFVGVDFCDVCCFFGVEHEFNGCHYRSHVDLPVDGADYGNRVGRGNQ